MTTSMQRTRRPGHTLDPHQQLGTAHCTSAGQQAEPSSPGRRSTLPPCSTAGSSRLTVDIATAASPRLTGDSSPHSQSRLTADYAALAGNQDSRLH
ncbi:unnamed protein product [Plutella xylostella]|nr:unnamed protein product [Plutella xylostella]CAG9120885.1 unnamed protein product [Plutella xylostella]CAG9137870.1 unnamed protein product [Plutella xylostella]